MRKNNEALKLKMSELMDTQINLDINSKEYNEIQNEVNILELKIIDTMLKSEVITLILSIDHLFTKDTLKSENKKALIALYKDLIKPKDNEGLKSKEVKGNNENNEVKEVIINNNLTTNNTKDNTMKTTTKEITTKSTVKEIKEALKEAKIEFNPKDNKALLLASYNEYNEVKEVQSIFNDLANNKKELKEVKEKIVTNENKAVPLVLSIVNLKSNNPIFNALNKKGKIKEVKKSIGSKNNLINDCCNFLLHNNLIYSNTITIANIRGINSLISKKVVVKDRIKSIVNCKEVKEAKEDKATIYNELVKKELATIRKEVKVKEAKEAKLLAKLAKEALEYKEVIKLAKEAKEVTIVKSDKVA